jgi:acetyltransferase-like isoleucine patch superfamily enzyme
LINNLRRLYKESGLLLMIVRLPSKFFKIVLDTLTTYYYCCFFNKVGSKCYIEFGAKISAPNRVSLGDNVFIGKGVEILSETSHGRLVVGNNVEIGRDCRIDITGDLVIKDDVHLSRGCQISTHTHGHNPKAPPIPCELTIEGNVWLGAEVFIMESCQKIEANSLLATRAVITKSILEKNTVYAGTPAKKIGARSG